MLIWIETHDDTLVSITDMRQLRLKSYHLDARDTIVYSTDATGYDRTVYDIEVVFPATDREYEGEEFLLARYSQKTLATTYQRYLGMSINRAALNREVFCLVPKVTETACIKLRRDFRKWDKEAKAKREAEAATKRNREAAEKKAGEILAAGNRKAAAAEKAASTFDPSELQEQDSEAWNTTI